MEDNYKTRPPELVPMPHKFRLLVWVHSHHETGEATELDFAEVDGRTNLGLLREVEKANDVEPFVDAGVPLDEWIWCIVELDHDKADFSVGDAGGPWIASVEIDTIKPDRRRKGAG